MEIEPGAVVKVLKEGTLIVIEPGKEPVTIDFKEVRFIQPYVKAKGSTAVTIID